MMTMTTKGGKEERTMGMLRWVGTERYVGIGWDA
jgi:hypothetical protein